MTKEKGLRPRRRKEPLENPYASVGSPIPGLVGPAELDRVLSDENLDALVDAARVPAGVLDFGKTRLPAAVWLRCSICQTVRGWLVDAHRPSVRDVAGELRELAQLLYAALDSGDTAMAAAAADAYAALSPAAREEIDRGGSLKPLPDVAAIRSADRPALELLFGLVPTDPAPPGEGPLFGPAATFAGTAADELRRAGRPPATRLEQLIGQIAISYEQATGRLPGRGERTPFTHLIRLLVGFLTDSETSDIADQPLRRVAEWRKSRKTKRK